jgi:hypothetical protein
LGWQPVEVVQYTFAHKQYVEQHISLIKKSEDRARLCEVYPAICLTADEKAQKNLSQDSRRMPVGKEYTEQNILVKKNGECVLPISNQPTHISL